MIFTSFKCGNIHISYKAIPVDEEGLPMIIDNTKYLKALELYIRCQVFTILFDLGRITQQVLNHTEQEYSWAAGQLEEEFKIPSLAEMESITNMINQLIPRRDEFAYSFDRLGNREHNKIHNNNSTFRESTTSVFPFYTNLKDSNCDCSSTDAVTIRQTGSNGSSSSSGSDACDAEEIPEEVLRKIFV